MIVSKGHDDICHGSALASADAIQVMLDYSVLIPAHNEASVIADALTPFRDATETPDVIVICNGCSDATAQAARSAWAGARVLEVEKSGKTEAINHGLAIARGGPVIVMDADVTISLDDLAALVAVLREPGVSAVSPLAEIDLRGADTWVQDYYRVFSAHRYMVEGVGGSGVYGLSEAGLRTLGRLPTVMSDDDFIRHFFPLASQRRVSIAADGRPVRAHLRPPRRLYELLLSEARWRAGDAEVRTTAVYGERHWHLRLQQRLRTARRLLLHEHVEAGALIRYVLIKLAGRAILVVNRFGRRTHIWHRDVSSREARR